MAQAKPNAKFDHVYAIIRLDKDATAGGLVDRNLVTVTKVVYSEALAEQEVKRLTNLNAGKGCEYFYQITRLDSRECKNLSEESPNPIADSASAAASQRPPSR
jgi:hypothetical protein